MGHDPIKTGTCSHFPRYFETPGIYICIYLYTSKDSQSCSDPFDHCSAIKCASSPDKTWQGRIQGFHQTKRQFHIQEELDYLYTYLDSPPKYLRQYYQQQFTHFPRYFVGQGNKLTPEISTTPVQPFSRSLAPDSSGPPGI